MLSLALFRSRSFMMVWGGQFQHSSSAREDWCRQKTLLPLPERPRYRAWCTGHGAHLQAMAGFISMSARHSSYHIRFEHPAFIRMFRYVSGV